MMPWHHLYNWLTAPWQRARRAEARLRDAQEAIIVLRVIIDGTTVAEWPLRANRVASDGPWDPTGAIAQAYSGMASYNIVTDIEILMGFTDDPDQAWRAQP
jgi:hypothetical protein